MGELAPDRLRERRTGSLVVLILGESYARFSTRLSATHEEYGEARGRKPILVFVQRGIKPDAQQKESLDEVQGGKRALPRRVLWRRRLKVAIIRFLVGRLHKAGRGDILMS